MHQADGERNGAEDKRHAQALERIVARDLMGEGIDYALASDDPDDLRYVLILAKHAAMEEKRKLELEKRFSQRLAERSTIEHICMRDAFQDHREEVKTLRANVSVLTWLLMSLLVLLLANLGANAF